MTTLIAQKHSFSRGLSIILMWIPIYPCVKFFRYQSTFANPYEKFWPSSI